ncbi:MAG: alpha/beta hydrolase [Phycisphaerales bacterium]|nr:alpha/beta hydrolase [Phycisphaerales bacterium]
MTDETVVEHGTNEDRKMPPRRPLRQRPWFRLVIYVAAFYMVWCTILYSWQDSLLFPAEMAAEPLPRLYSAKTVELIRDLDSGGKVVAWFIPAPTLKPRSPCIIYFHGNAEIIDHQHTVVEGYLRLGCSVLLPEYRGYGRSAGSPSEKGIVEDAVYFHDEIVKRDDVDKSRVVFHGRSLGGGPAAQLAARRKPKLLILESTFSSAAAMAHKYFAPMFLVKHPFRTDHVLESLDVPVLLFHGSRDDIIPVEHGRKLRDLAFDATYVEFDCRHNDFPGHDNEEKYWADIERFMEKHGVIGDGA